MQVFLAPAAQNVERVPSGTQEGSIQSACNVHRSEIRDSILPKTSIYPAQSRPGLRAASYKVCPQYYGESVPKHPLLCMG